MPQYCQHPPMSKFQDPINGRIKFSIPCWQAEIVLVLTGSKKAYILRNESQFNCSRRYWVHTCYKKIDTSNNCHKENNGYLGNNCFTMHSNPIIQLLHQLIWDQASRLVPHNLLNQNHSHDVSHEIPFYLLKLTCSNHAHQGYSCR